MNRYKFCLYIISTLLLIACGTSSSDEYEPVTTPMNFNGSIASGTDDWLDTRATSTVAFPEGEKFGVYAYNTGASLWDAAKTTATPNVMCNQEVEKKAAGFTYTPARYWIPALNYSFFAYAPYGATGITLLSGDSTPDVPKLEYTMASSTTNQADILYASVLDQKETDATAVALNFKHALARIRFTAEVTAGASQYTAKVTGVTFSHLMNRGTLELHTGTWSSTSGDITCTILNQGDAADDTNIPYSTTTPKVALSTPIYILPQTIAAAGEVTIHYEIISPFEVTPIQRTATFPQSGVKFSSAQSVNYHFIIKLTEVKFTLQVENWEEQNDPLNGITSME